MGAAAINVNVAVLVKGPEHYVFLYTDANRAEALKVLDRFASNPELSFTWYDAATLRRRIREEAKAPNNRFQSR